MGTTRQEGELNRGRRGTSKINSKKPRPKTIKRAWKRKVLTNPLLCNGHYMKVTLTLGVIRKDLTSSPGWPWFYNPPAAGSLRTK